MKFNRANIVTNSKSYLSYLKDKDLVWFNPCNGIIVFWNKYFNLKKELNISHADLWKHRKLKRYKEIYITSIVAKTIELSEKQGKWWIAKTKQDPPDGVIGKFEETKSKGQFMKIREIEIVEHLNGDIIETINNKIHNKNYEPNTILVCYVSQGGSYDFVDISSRVIELEGKLNHVFVVFPGGLLSDLSAQPGDAEIFDFAKKTTVIQLKPEYNLHSANLINSCAAWRRGEEGNFFKSEGLGRSGARQITLENPPLLFDE
jgi:hypothetical protein